MTKLKENNESLDLFYIFRKTNDFFNRGLILFYKITLFTLKFWILIISLIFLGLIGGYFANANKVNTKEANIQVRINFELGRYVYNEIDLLNKKIANLDSIFLKERGIWKNGQPLVNSIEIEPLVAFQELIEDYGSSNRTFEILMDNYNFEGDNSSSRNFKYEFRYHLLKLNLSNEASSKTIESILSVINENLLLKELKNIEILNIESRISSNLEMLEQINTLVSAYAQTDNLKTLSLVPILDKDISGLIDKKRAIQAQLEDYRRLKVVSSNIIVLISEPIIVENKSGMLNNKMVLYPILLIFSFYLISLLVFTFLRAKRLYEGRESNII